MKVKSEVLGLGVTRRELLRGTAGAALAWTLGMAGGGSPAAASPGSLTRVVLVRDRNVLGTGRRPDPEILAGMLDRAVAALLGEENTSDAWRQLISPDDTVGIKSNAWRFLPTPPELEEALVKRVRDAGVSSSRVSVDDRGVLQDRVFRESTALVNVRPMRTHHWAGVGSCIKNYIMFSPDPPRWHPDSCADLAGLWDLPAVRGRTRLNILVMLTPLFHGKGPHHFQAQYTWEYGGLIVGTDPVAVDATGLRILDAKRRSHFRAGAPLVVPPKHIRLAETKFGLGFSDPARIEVVKIGWKEGSLI